MEFPGPVYVIYMPQREEYIRKVFSNMGIKAQFVPAVNAKELPPLYQLHRDGVIGDKYLSKYLANENYPHMDLRAFEEDPKNSIYINSKLKGVLALQLSYMRIFELFLNTKKSHCFIFEDDILQKNSTKTARRLQDIFKELPESYDIINLGRCFDKCKQNRKYSKNLVVNTKPLCTHACGYSVNIAEYVLQNALPMQEACDTLLRRLYQKSGFSASPALFFQNKALAGLLGNVAFMPECSDNIKKKP